MRTPSSTSAPQRKAIVGDLPDEVRLAEVAQREWVAITHDANIRRRPNQRAAVLDGGLGLIAKFYPPTPADIAKKLKPRGRIELWIAG